MKILKRAARTLVDPEEIERGYSFLCEQEVANPNTDPQAIMFAYQIYRLEHLGFQQRLAITFRVEALANALKSERYIQIKKFKPEPSPQQVFEAASKATLVVGEYDALFDIEDFVAKLCT